MFLVPAPLEKAEMHDNLLLVLLDLDTCCSDSFFAEAPPPLTLATALRLYGLSFEFTFDQISTISPLSGLCLRLAVC